MKAAVAVVVLVVLERQVALLLALVVLEWQYLFLVLL
jgi:hypothetical protein